MRLALLAPANSVHTQKWCEQLTGADIDVHVITAHPENEVPSGPTELGRKISFLLNAGSVRRKINQLQPHIVHSFYAAGYGWWGARSRFSPFIMSVWGSDITRTPGSSFIARQIIRYNLKRADIICATSNYLKDQTVKLTPDNGSKVRVMPFGVDTQKFWKSSKPGATEAKVVVGTARGLEYVYGLDILVRAFAVMKRRIPDSLLRIAGKGTIEGQLRQIVADEGLVDSVEFVGEVSQDDMPGFLNSLDMFVMPSREEAFGVATLEAMSCRVPVIATRVGGNNELLDAGKFGALVESENCEELATAMFDLAHDEELRKLLARAARKHVVENYDLHLATRKMIDLYEEVLDRFRSNPDS